MGEEFTLVDAIAEVINGRDLSAQQAELAMDGIMAGSATPAQIGSYLTALRMKGETIDEIVGSARSMRRHVVAVPTAVQSSGEGTLVDTCGTGGDGLHTFNISTTAAFVAAAHGVRVAKHGNRAASSRSGSADVLMALGGNLDLTSTQVGRCVDEIGIGFLYAVKHHPAMRYAIGPRREIGQRTIFNMLGPLTNPAGATHQLLGVFDGSLTEPLARVLQALGSKAAMVVHSHDGMDELSTTAPNRVSYLRGGDVRTFTLDATEYGLDRAPLSSMVGGTPDENAAITRAILAGEDRGSRRDIVLLNAAAALAVEHGEMLIALEQAADAIDSGRALRKLESWVEMTQSFA